MSSTIKGIIEEAVDRRERDGKEVGSSDACLSDASELDEKLRSARGKYQNMENKIPSEIKSDVMGKIKDKVRSIVTS